MQSGSGNKSPDDVVIGIQFRIQDLRNQMSKIRTKLKTTVNQLQSDIRDISSFSPTEFKKLTGMDQAEMLGGYRDALQTTKDAANKAFDGINKKVDYNRVRLLKAKKAAAAFNREFKQPPFAGYALSLMFAGMALKQVFDMIWRSSVDTFKEVMNSIEDTTNGFSMMEGSLKYLQFTAGQALEPIAMWLIPIIDSVSEWVSQNDKLAATLIIIAGVLGTVLMVGGMLKLAFDGFVGALIFIKPYIIGITAALGGLSLTAILIIGLITAALIAAFVMWRTNFLGFKDILNNIWEAVKSNFMGFITFIKEMFGGIWKVIKGIWHGDMDLIIEGLKQMFSAWWKYMEVLFKNGVTILYNIFVFLGNAMTLILSGITNFITGSFINIIKMAIGIIRNLIEAANKLPFINISTSGLQKAEDSIETLKDKLKINPKLLEPKSKEDIFGKDDIESKQQSSPNIVNNFYNYDGIGIQREMKRYI